MWLISTFFWYKTEGYTEIASTGDGDNEARIGDLDQYHHILLSLLRRLRICSFWRPDAGQSPDRLRLLRALLVDRLRKCLHRCALNRRLSGDDHEFMICNHLTQTAFVLIELINSSWTQMYSQPVFAMVEEWLQGTGLVNRRCTLELPLMPALRLDVQRLCFRTAYVVSTTAIAMAFPYFNQVLGVLGAINFWPMSIYFPVEMCLRREGVEAWTRKWILLRAFSAVCFVLTMLALIASIQGLITQRFSSHPYDSWSLSRSGTKSLLHFYRLLHFFIVKSGINL